MNVVALFALQADRTPDALALAWDGGTMTYSELRRKACSAGAAFARRGVTAGDRVAILLDNDPAFPVALLGCLWIGGIACVLSAAWPAADAARAYGEADASLLVTTRQRAEAMHADPESCLFVGEPGAAGFETSIHRESASAVAIAPCRTEDIASVLFSSGTTGDAKGVALTHGNIVFNARAKHRYCGITRGERLALVVPIAHCFGQNVVLLGALTAGASVRLYRRFDAEQLRYDIATGSVSMLFAVPTAFRRLLDHGDPRALQPLRYAMSAAAPLDAALEREWEATQGRSLHQGYGLTECSPFATYNHHEWHVPGSVGAAIDGVEVRIGDAEGDEWMGPGERGEVAIRGPNVMHGYWRKPEATARALRGGWLRTGDIGTLDDAGHLRLVDRVDDVINVAGFKAWPSDVERVMAGHPDVAECMAHALPDEVRGNRVGLMVVPRAGRVIDERSLIALAQRELSGYQRPAHITVVTELPRSASGKLLRRAARNAAAPRGGSAFS